MRVFDALSGIFPRAGGVLFLLTALATTGWSQVETDEQGEVLAPNMASVFVGLTAEPADRGSGASFTLGIDYERRLTEYVGIGAFAEGSFGNTEREALLGIPLSAHPYRGGIIVVAPLVEISQPRGGDSETNIGVRAGLAYEFSAGEPYVIVPELYFDFVGSDVMIVFGFAAGLGF